MYAQWPSHLADCQSEHAPAQWDTFKIPLKLLVQPQPIQSSGILALPNELLLQILMHVNPVSQLFLALTCKRLLVVSTMTVTMITSAPKHRSHRLDCSAMLAVLHTVRPTDARGRSKTSWAPCCVCYRYRPKRKPYWKDVQKSYPKEWVCGILVDYDSIVQSWSKKHSSSYQCPDCWCEERMNKYGHLVN
ncbi:Putative F-box domain-containing protein [Colletotrichum destructivum]|uniref:F-box domain-containing protein n=1 Tax=Colletotrichum destructivum TaxID=34406 RepID=A0AAX4I0Q5_9PEZI|nr:Putative F-box domain-containing protein [Colletotrichum destructivum]